MEPITEPVITVTARPPPAPSRDHPADGGPPLGPNESTPFPVHIDFETVLRGLNPLHHLPVVGMIYRAVSGETLPTSERVAGALITGAFFGGPLGVMGTVVLSVIEEMFRMGPDATQRPWGETPSAEAALAATTQPGQG